MRFKFKSAGVLALGDPDINPNRISKKTGLSYTTVYRYFGGDRDFSSIDLRVLVQILTDGIGLSVEQVQALKLGDLIEFIPD